MLMIRSLRSLIVSILALWRDLSQKQVGARAGIPQKKVSLYLKRDDMEDDLYTRFLAAVNGRPAEVAIVTGCLESLGALS
jgi:predicted transcriptional regulator